MERVLREVAEQKKPDIIFGDAFATEEATRRVAKEYPMSPSSSARAGAPPNPTCLSMTTGSTSPLISPACSPAG